MSIIRITTLTIILILLAALPSQPTRATPPNELEQFSCTNVTGVPQIECEALVALYNGTDGPNWRDTTGWLVTNTPCSWYGVTCDGEQITELNLSGEPSARFGLQGDLPAEIGDLNNLTELDLSDNQLSSLPAEIGNLNNLISLFLINNQLSRLPAQIGDLDELAYLYLESNQLSTLPAEIGNLNNLIYLFLINNQLSRLPAEIGNLNNLTNLRLSDNQLSSLPVEIGNLDNLVTLRLSDNQLSSLPAEVGNLNNLDDLWLGYNQLTSLPTNFVNLTNMMTLNLEHNRLTVTDEALRTWMNTHDPDWADTQNNDPEQFSCTNVTEVPQIECEALVALYNGTDGPNWRDTTGWLVTNTPCSWYGVTCDGGLITKLSLSGEPSERFGLQGDLPTEIGDLNNLTELDLSDNQLSSLPAEIGNLDNLIFLFLINNQLSSLPVQIGDLDELSYLYLESNQLSRLPAEIGNLNNLIYLFLINNQLSRLPAEIGTLNSLTNLRLSDNQLSSLPAEIGNLDNLVTLRLSDNQLSSLPAEIGNLNNLDDLWLGYNQLTSLPTNFINLANMMTLNLEQNRLTVTDEALRTWMNTHDPDWADTQNFDPQTDNTPTYTPLPPSTTIPSTTTPKNTPASTYTATPVPTATPTNLAPTISGPDSYESDDSCQLSRTLPLDGPPQPHNFHQEGDEDWLEFELQSGVSYHLLAETSNSDIQLEIELHLNCEGIPDETSAPSFGSAEIIFSAPTSGRYYAKITNRDPKIFGDETAYELSLGIHDTGGDLAIIITGHDDGFTLQGNIIQAANRAYRAFRNGGILPNRIRYLGLQGDDRGDADHDEISDIDTEATVANVQEVITQWAAEHADDEGRIFIYLMDHGLVDELMVNGSNDVLTAHQLDSWLDQLESETEAPIAVIYEACLSGSFITGVQSISQAGRIIITSTDDSTNAFPRLQGGAHFSDAFFSALRQGKDFHQAFRIGHNASAQTLLEQYPMIDDNGDGRYTTDDGNIARTWHLTQPAALGDGEEQVLGQEVSLSSPQPPSAESIIDGHGLIQVSASQLGNISEVWAEVYKPSFVEPAPVTNGIMPELDLDRVEFSDNDGDGVYRGLYDNFTQVGTYRFVIYGADVQGNLITPTVLEMAYGTEGEYRLYLPVVQR